MVTSLPSSMSFQSLPTEIYDAIFSHILPPDLQGTVLAVTRAIPLSSVPLHHLFRNVRISHPGQAILLHRRLRQNDSNSSSQPKEKRPASWVRVISLESWSVDAEVVINLLRMLPQLESLNIWVGPTNFAPEHLEELFSKPLTVQYLAIRFRPYVQKANYYQFLRGSYFDASLLALARWPSGKLPVLSIVQDTCDPGIGQKQAFAQPIVFFRLDPCLSLLLHSPSMAPSLKSLRLRIPARPIARPLCGMTPSATPPYASDPTPSPDLEFLDISTCNILDNELDMILTHFPSLKHFILDGCPLFRGEGDWNDLGKRCALAGVRRAKQRERALKEWIEADQTGANFDAEENLPNQENRPKRGRKGLAIATISLRESRHVPSPSSSRTTSQLLISQNSLQRAARIRILPSPPTLETLSVTVPWINPDKYSMLRAEFDAGWAEGVALLAVTKARLRSSAKNGCRVMRFSSTFTSELETSQDEWLEQGLEGLHIDATDGSAFGTSSQDNAQLPPPVLCFAGPGRGPNHEAHCGHSVGWVVMKDEV